MKLFNKRTKMENNDAEEQIISLFQSMNFLADKLEELAKIVVINGEIQNSLIGTIQQQNEILAKNQKQIEALQRQINYLSSVVLSQIAKNRHVSA